MPPAPGKVFGGGLSGDRWEACVTWVCGRCGWLGGTNDAGQVYCNNGKCQNYGKLFEVRISTMEVESCEA